MICKAQVYILHLILIWRKVEMRTVFRSQEEVRLQLSRLSAQEGGGLHWVEEENKSYFTIQSPSLLGNLFPLLLIPSPSLRSWFPDQLGRRISSQSGGREHYFDSGPGVARSNSATRVRNYFVMIKTNDVELFYPASFFKNGKRFLVTCSIRKNAACIVALRAAFTAGPCFGTRVFFHTEFDPSFSGCGSVFS